MRRNVKKMDLHSHWEMRDGKNAYSLETENTLVEETKKHENVESVMLREEIADIKLRISMKKKELEVKRDAYKNRLLHLKNEFEERIANLETFITDTNERERKISKKITRKRSKMLRLKKKVHGYKYIMDLQGETFKELGFELMEPEEVLKTPEIHSEEVNQFGMKIRGLLDDAQIYHTALAENRKLHNEVQSLKGAARINKDGRGVREHMDQVPASSSRRSRKTTLSARHPVSRIASNLSKKMLFSGN